MNESDVWKLSSTLRSKPLYTAFESIKSSKLPASSWGSTWTLTKHLLRANSRDLALEAILTFFSVFFDYLGPFFLKRILDSIEYSADTGDRAALSRAYVFAFLALLSTLCKAQADVQHLWFGRRAGTRIRSELMSAIYDKALKRKDFSGIVDKEKIKEKAKPGKWLLICCQSAADAWRQIWRTRRQMIPRLVRTWVRS